MEPKTPRYAARIVVSVLALAALGSLAGGGALVLERLGVITLRRVPTVELLTRVRYHDECTIAIINTDTVSGSFAVACYKNSTQLVLAKRLWVPARSITLLSIPGMDFTYSGDVVRLAHGNPELSSSDPLVPDVTRWSGVGCLTLMIPRGERRIDYPWLLLEGGEGVFVESSRKIELEVVSASLGNRLRIRVGDGTWETKPVVVPPPLAKGIEVEACGRPGFVELNIGWRRARQSEGAGGSILIHDPDMTVIDERSPRSP